METVTLQAEVREERGKGPARRLRMQGKVPGVFYGPGIEPTPLTLSPKDLEHALRSDHGRNVVFSLNVNGKEELAMVRDLATDPVDRHILHVDLYRVFEGKEIDVRVPLKAVGRAAGVVQGGVLNVTRRTLPLRAKPGFIPAAIEIDVTNLEIKDTVSVKDVEFPGGVVSTLNPELTLAIVLEPRKQTEEELAAEAAAAAEAAGEGAEGVEGAEAAAADAAAGDTPAGDDKPES